jgi:hypothetical protein
MTRRKKRALVVVAALAVWANVQRRADALPLAPTDEMASTWTAGPTRLTFALDQWGTPFVFEQNPGGSFFLPLGTPGLSLSLRWQRLAPVVVQPNGPGTWQTHVFFNVGGGIAEEVRENDGHWRYVNRSFLPGLVSASSEVVAASNVYRRGDTLSPQSSVAQMAVYVMGSDGMLYTRFTDHGAWTPWINTNPGSPIFNPQIANVAQFSVTSEFNNGSFSTSVWVAGYGVLMENRGLFNGPRTWINHSGNVHGDQRPEAVTWYDRAGAMNPSSAHTRVYVQTYQGVVEAFYREPGEVTGWDIVDQSGIGLPMSAGEFVGSCAGCPNPPELSVVVGLNNLLTDTFSFLAKDNSNTSPSYLDTWTTISPYGGDLAQNGIFTRMDYGAGLGVIYTVNSAGHLLELSPTRNRWLNHGYPGMTYSYAAPVFDGGDDRRYTGDGDWAGAELKGECGSNEWTVGVSTSATQAHSMQCASTDSATNFTSFQTTLSISNQNDGWGNHGLGDWDPGYFKGECLPNGMVTGLSLGSGGGLNHVRCSSTPDSATNCRALPFPSSDNRETPNSVSDWAVGYYKAECANGSAITGISRSVATGDVHAVLCCDFSMM